MKNKNTIIAVIAVLLIVAVIFVAAKYLLPTKEKDDKVNDYKNPSVFDIFGFFADTITGTVETIKNTTTSTTTTTTTTTQNDLSDEDISNMLWKWA